MNDHFDPAVFLAPVYLDDAPVTGLERAFALPPSREDYENYVLQTWRGRLHEGAANMGMAVGREFGEALSDALIMHNPKLLRKAGSRENVIWYALADSIRRPGYPKNGRPRDSYDRLAQVYADLNFLKRKTGLSIRVICQNILNPLMHKKYKLYEERYHGLNAVSLRKKYQQAAKLEKTDFRFVLFLSGHEGLLPNNDNNAMDAAIERHALKA
jgi:hypothetical protein